eukprot:GCRY01003802.1.p1 GENE.GCRY01003802.1~~GCRY01003802.1.p1  ORF type:complete len:297 (-),score=40.47 GCRY01003802.1:12-902(-)
MATRNRTRVFVQYRERSHRSGLFGGEDLEFGAVDRKKLLSSSDDSSMISSMPAWVDVVDDIHYDIRCLKEKIDDLARLHKHHLLPGFDDRMEEEQEIEVLTQEITRSFKKSKNKIKQLSGPSFGQQEQDVKMRKNAQVSLATELQNLSESFKQHQDSYLSKMERQEKQVRLGFDDRFETQPTMEHFEREFTPAQKQQVDQDLHLIEERSEAVEAIARSVVEIAEIFNDLSILVIEQGTILDRIDYNLEQTAVHTEQAVSELQKASKHQKKARKKMCILLLLVLIICGFLVLTIQKS